MVNEEIYILTKHGGFQADYIENLPIYRRRHFLHLLDVENEETRKNQEKAEKRYNSKAKR
ncbi:MAG: hypothetical protein ACOC2U_01165 [bacterium]